MQEKLYFIKFLNQIYFHRQHLIYRDIKPANCLIGRVSQNSSDIIHIVDFGLAKQFIDPESGKHIEYEEKNFITGTLHFMSINAHQVSRVLCKINDKRIFY